jgi:hypothetical protein
VGFIDCHFIFVSNVILYIQFGVLWRHLFDYIEALKIGDMIWDFPFLLLLLAFPVISYYYLTLSLKAKSCFCLGTCRISLVFLTLCINGVFHPSFLYLSNTSGSFLCNECTRRSNIFDPLFYSSHKSGLFDSKTALVTT